MALCGRGRVPIFTMNVGNPLSFDGISTVANTATITTTFAFSIHPRKLPSVMAHRRVPRASTTSFTSLFACGIQGTTECATAARKSPPQPHSASTLSTDPEDSARHLSRLMPSLMRGEYHESIAARLQESVAVFISSSLLLGLTMAVLGSAASPSLAAGFGGVVETSPLEFLRSFDFKAFLETVAAEVDGLGSLGYIYFSAVYIFAEVLALPAVPLTASAGYLFGALPGTCTVLVSATIAAGVSFLIGRNLLRGYIEEMAADNKTFRAIDAAVGREGFKVVLLLRLSPLLPFALSNYFYGLTSVEFGPYLLATLIGFAPGTFAYVYTGEAAKVGCDSYQDHSPRNMPSIDLVMTLPSLFVLADDC